MKNVHLNHENELIKVFDNVAAHAIPFFPVLSSKTEVQLIRYSENATYSVQNQVTGARHILRVSRPGYNTKSEIKSELAWLKSISKSLPSITIAMPIAGKDDTFIQSIKLENDPQEYYCTLFTYLVGEPPKENNKQVLLKHFEKIGEIAARLHEHSIYHHADHKKTVNRTTWDYETLLGKYPKWGRWQDGLSITRKRAVLFERVSETIKQRLAHFGKDTERFGLIHSDLRMANIIVNDGQLQLIDFDDCGFGWYLFDLAASLSFMEAQSNTPDLMAEWVRGYRKVRSLSKEEVDEIPTFIMMRRLQLISWIGSRENETTDQLGGRFSEETDRLAIEYLQKMEMN